MAKKKSKESLSEKVENVVESILNLTGVTAKISVEENEEGIFVNIDGGEESGLLIGGRGRTLQSLQTIVSLAVNKDKKDWVRVNIDVANWQQKEEEKLKELAQKTAERVRTSGQSQNLYNLTPTQRRVIHLALADEKDIKTQSLGEGRDRYLEISSK